MLYTEYIILKTMLFSVSLGLHIIDLFLTLLRCLIIFTYLKIQQILKRLDIHYNDEWQEFSFLYQNRLFKLCLTVTDFSLNALCSKGLHK